MSRITELGVSPPSSIKSRLNSSPVCSNVSAPQHAVSVCEAEGLVRALPLAPRPCRKSLHAQQQPAAQPPVRPPQDAPRLGASPAVTFSPGANAGNHSLLPRAVDCRPGGVACRGDPQGMVVLVCVGARFPKDPDVLCKVSRVPGAERHLLQTLAKGVSHIALGMKRGA